MPAWIIVLAAFAVGAGAFVAGAAAVARLPGYLVRRRIEQRMQDPGFQDDDAGRQASIIKRVQTGALPALEKLIGRTRQGGWLTRLIAQAGSQTSASAVVVLSIGCGGACGLATWLVAPFGAVPLIVGLLGASVPVVILRHRRSVRLKQFEEQFPEALDLLSRAIRAGHAFATAMGMVAGEALSPTGPEFRKTFDEQNFGLPLKDALNNLSTRVPLLDVKFFVTAVLIQRETGGNLSEILENLANVVRERFKVLRQVRVHTAHGRFTGYVLIALPAALAGALMFINPEHMGLLFKEPMGHVMLTIAVVLQIAGFIWIKRVVKIEV